MLVHGAVKLTISTNNFDPGNHVVNIDIFVTPKPQAVVYKPSKLRHGIQFLMKT